MFDENELKFIVVLLGCELCEKWKEDCNLINGMFICSECQKDPANTEYTFNYNGID
jgi:hypothetical protein